MLDTSSYPNSAVTAISLAIICKIANIVQRNQYQNRGDAKVVDEMEKMNTNHVNNISKPPVASSEEGAWNGKNLGSIPPVENFEIRVEVSLKDNYLPIESCRR